STIAAKCVLRPSRSATPRPSSRAPTAYTNRFGSGSPHRSNEATSAPWFPNFAAPKATRIAAAVRRSAARNLEPICLEQLEPDLAARREGRRRVPQLLERHLGDDRDRRRVDGLGNVGAGKGRANEDALL